MMLLLLDSLDRDKYEIFVICRPGGPLVKKLKDSGYHYLPVNSLRRNLSILDLFAFLQILFLCLKYRFDIVHTHSSKTGFLGRIAARIAGVPNIIHTVHGFPFHEHQLPVARYFYQALEIIAARFCDHLVIVNNYEREQIQENRLFPTRKIRTIYNGIESNPNIEPRRYGSTGLIAPAKNNPELSEFFVIGSVARFTRAKNVINMTEVAILVCRANPEIKFVFIGDGELWDSCYDLVASAGMHKQILMPGWQSNVDYWLQNMDVFLLYSRWEGLSISILEAMSYGLPIVASDIKGNNELVTNENGILVQLDDHIRLRQTLSELPSRKSDLENWSRNALTRSRIEFGLTDFVARYEELYQDPRKGDDQKS